MSEAEIARARARTVAARARLSDALETLKQKIAPRALALGLARATRSKAIDTAEAGAEAVKARPAVAAGVAALAALFLARKPIARAISSVSDETPDEPARSGSDRSRKAR